MVAEGATSWEGSINAHMSFWSIGIACTVPRRALPAPKEGEEGRPLKTPIVAATGTAARQEDGAHQVPK